MIPSGMAIARDHSKKAKQVLKPVLGAALMAYFAYHAVQGDRGLLAWWQLRYQMETAEQELAAVKAEADHLKHRISLLKPESIDLDMVDERTRLLFAYAKPDEFILIPPAQ